MKNINELNIAFLMGRLSEKGGISRVTSILSSELYPYYKSIHVISYHKKEKFGYNWNANLTSHDLLQNTWSMKKGFFKALLKLRNLLKLNKIDVLIICGHNMGPLAVIASILKKTKLVYWPHSSFKAMKMSRFKSFNERFTAAFSSVVVSLTKADKKNFQKKTLARKVEQIYNPIDPILGSIKSKYNSDTKKIISVGRLTKSKQFELLIDIAKIVFEKHKDYSWDIYGSGEDENNIRRKIKFLNLEEKVLLKGHTNNLYSVYPNYSILVMTSEYEGFPMSLLEGMAFKLPLVSFDIPTGPNEIIRENKNGFLIEPFNIIEMANKINLLIEDPIKRMAFSNGNKNFVEEFNIGRIKDKWVTLIDEIYHVK